MDNSKILKIIIDSVYSVGVIIALGLLTIALLGPNKAFNPMSMIVLTWKEQAVIWLAFGTIPMLLACTAFYKANIIKSSTYKKRRFILIFLPGFICTACALLVIGVIVVGMMNM